MKLPRIAVRRPVTVLMGVAMILVLGLISLNRLPIDLFPEIEPPVLAIITEYPDAGPHEVENLVSRPIEEVLGTVNNIKSVSSVSRKGSSIVIAEFNWGIDMDFAALDVREKVDLVKDFLPDESEAPMVVKFDPTSMPIMQLVLNGDRSPYELRYIADHTLKSRLERLEGVASVNVSGGQEREIRVVLHPGLLEAHGVSLTAVSNALRAANLNLPAGTVVENSREYVLRTRGEFTDIEQIRAVRVPSQSGGLVRLTDIGEVIDGFKETTQLSRYNGQPSVLLSIQKEASANTVQVAERVRRAVKTLDRELGEDLSLAIAQDMSVFIKGSIQHVTENAVFGGLLAMLVLFTFLRSLRPTVIVGVAIPISVIAAFILIYFSKTTLNMISLGGLALGIGMLVDNAIVVLENIFRHREEGEDALTAAQLGAEQVGTAITASTFTTVSVFIPVVFVSGIAAEIFRDMALTVTFSLLTSLAISLTLVPMLASQLLGNGNVSDGRRGIRCLQFVGTFINRLQDLYGQGMAWVLHHRFVTVSIAVVVFVVALLLIPRVGMEFLPSMDQGEIQIDIAMPKGTRLVDTDKVVRTIEDYVAELPDTEAVYASVGQGSSGMGIGGDTGAESGSVGVRLVPRAQRQHSTREVIAQLRKFVAGIPGADISVTMMETMGASFGKPVQVELRGDDLDLLGKVADRLVEVIKKIPGTREVTSSLGESRPEIQVEVHREKAAAYGISVSQVASVLRTAVNGTTVTKFRTGGREIDVTVQLGEAWRQNPEDVGNVPIPTARGTLVPLRDIATLHYGQSPVEINREGQSRLVAVTGEVAGRDLRSVVADIRQAISEFPLPEGITVDYGGQNEQMMESFGQLGVAFMLGVLLVFIILASQFESLLQPLAIMVTLPLAAIGVVLGLLLGGVTFNVVAFVGVIMLAGIVVNNAIVLIDYINQLRAGGMERNAALILAGRTRLRPILMTSLTTILGMMPLALRTGEGSEMAKPIAFVVIGGLLTSTLLTLFIVPVFYTFLDGLGQRIMDLFRRYDLIAGVTTRKVEKSIEQ